MSGTEFTISSQTLVETWLRIEGSAKPKVYKQVASSAEINSVSYWLEIIFSAGIATFGLVLNSPAVIIGAMLISPLMNPIMATGLALAVGDLYLTIRALLNLVLSIATAIGLSAILVWLLPFHTLTPEIVARTNPNLLDLGIALFSGLAGSIVVCRGGTSGGVTALPGVAIAVALMPPLCTMGFGLGSGVDLTIMSGAGLLFLTNIVAIVSSAFIVFLLVGMNSPAVRAEIGKSYLSVPERRAFLRQPAVRLLARSGKLRWRILMLVILLSSIAIPLRKALLQVAGEATARAAVEQTVKRLIANGSVVSQQVQVSRNAITIRLLSTKPISSAQISKAREDLIRRTGRDVVISVEEVARRRELQSLLERMNAPAITAPAPPVSIEPMRADLIGRIRPAVDAIWPAEITLQNLDVVLTPSNIALNIQYEAPQDLDPVALDLLQNTLRDKLKAPALTINAERTISPPQAKTTIESKKRVKNKK